MGRMILKTDGEFGFLSTAVKKKSAPVSQYKVVLHIKIYNVPSCVCVCVGLVYKPTTGCSCGL